MSAVTHQSDTTLVKRLRIVCSCNSSVPDSYWMHVIPTWGNNSNRTNAKGIKVEAERHKGEVSKLGDRWGCLKIHQQQNTPKKNIDVLLNHTFLWFWCALIWKKNTADPVRIHTSLSVHLMSPSIHYHQLVICHTQTAGFYETIKGFHLGRLATNKSRAIFGDVYGSMWWYYIGILLQHLVGIYIEYIINYSVCNRNIDPLIPLVGYMIYVTSTACRSSLITPRKKCCQFVSGKDYGLCHHCSQ